MFKTKLDAPTWGVDIVSEPGSGTRPALVVVDMDSSRLLGFVRKAKFDADDLVCLLTSIAVEHGRPNHVLCDNSMLVNSHGVADLLEGAGINLHFTNLGNPALKIWIEAAVARGARTRSSARGGKSPPSRA